MATKPEILKIETAVILGAGNVAWHLGHALRNIGIRILQVYNRTSEPGKLLAESIGAGFTSSPSALSPKADLYILAVSDDATSQVAGSFGFLQSGILVHTSGSLPMNMLSESALHYGVFYPLQTFTKEKAVDFKNVPVLIEGSSEEVSDLLMKLASRLTDQAYRMNSDDRLIMHCAAVLSSNFTNHMLLLTEKIVKEFGLLPGLLKPLMTETINKAFDAGPLQAQTGPARRGNLKIIDKHMELLKPWPEIQKIYKVLSESIIRQYSDTGKI